MTNLSTKQQRDNIDDGCTCGSDSDAHSITCAIRPSPLPSNAWRVPLPEQVRGQTHGDYTQMAQIAQIVKDALRSGPNWDKMAPHCRETLESSATKMARIVCGDFSCYDHWDDLRGYPQLVLDRMVKPGEK